MFIFGLQGNWLFDHYGLAMKIVWGVGILAAGQSSTMTVEFFFTILVVLNLEIS